MLTVSVDETQRPDGPGLDAGALAVRVARSWAQAGRDVLLVDADAHGTGLAERTGGACRLALDPARRGLPTLIASRASLSFENVVGHCWQLPTGGGGSVRLLGAPAHPQGARLSALWLAERSTQLGALGCCWAVVVSMPGPPVDAYAALGAAATHRVVLTGAPGTAPPGGVRAVLSAFWFRFGPDPVTLLLDGDDDVHGCDGAITAAAERRVLGWVGPVRETALLGGRVGRRDRARLAVIDAVAARLWEPSASASALVTGAGR